MTRETPYEAMNTLQNEHAKHGMQVYLRGVGQSTYSSSVVKEIFAAVSERFTPDLHVTMIFEMFPRGKMDSVPKDACAFNTRGPASNIVALIDWEEASDERMAKAKGHVEALTQIIASREEHPKDALDKVYANYIGEDAFRDGAARKVFGDNYPRLQEMKKKYDPDMAFSKWFPITPA